MPYNLFSQYCFDNTFSQAQPRLHMRLDGGARLAATAWVTPRPAVVIRRHRLRVFPLYC